MNLAQERVEVLRRVFPDIQVIPEAGADLVYFPKLLIRHAGSDVVVDALLRPSLDGGYFTRLYLSEPLTKRGNNWT